MTRLLTVMALLAAAPALSQGLEMAALGGYTTAGALEHDSRTVEDLKLEGGCTWGASVGFFFSPRLGVEVSWARQDSAVELTAVPASAEMFDVAVDQVQGSFVYQLGDAESRFRPFLTAGAGTALFGATDMDSEVKPSFSVGVGRWLPRPGVLSGYIIASPVFAEGRVFVAMGQSPGHGDGPSLIHAIRSDGQGDVTGSGLVWTSRDVGRVVGTPIVKDGLLYVGDLGGAVHCLDAATGAHLWKHETNDPIWGSLLLAGDRLYVGNEGGLMTVLRAGRRKEVLAQIEMDAPLRSRPAVVGDSLYLATATRLYLIAAQP